MFQCYDQALLTDEFLVKQATAMYFSTDGCTKDTFVVRDALYVSPEQLAALRTQETAEASAVEAVAGVAVPPYDAFTVFSKKELRKRKKGVLVVCASAFAIVVALFFWVKVRNKGTHEPAMYEFITSTPWLRVCLAVNHFLAYAVAIVLPAVASSRGRRAIH